MNAYTTTVGIEVHAELKTKTKMFCGCLNNPHAAEPNTHVCPVCMAHPGTLPVPNKEAVKFLMMVGRAINGTLADYSEFDRKNYFYPDIPKAYQISQYKFPFVSGGELAGVKIRRVHLEEDTARSQHDQGDGSLVDFNRAGVPLMELVTEPVIHDAETAGTFARELQLLLRTIGVSDANMERGEMRVEANISVSKTEELGTLSEVKNLNSVKAMESAIVYETKRQIEVLEAGGTLVQETRGWDENKSKTFSQRTKETAEDYRYFPDPDLPKFNRTDIAEFSDDRIDEILPEIPLEKRLYYKDLGLTKEIIETVITDPVAEKFVRAAIEHDTKADPKAIANYFTTDLLGVLEETESELVDGNPVRLNELVALAKSGEITSRVAKDLLVEVVFEDLDPKAVAEDRGLIQSNSKDDLLPLVEQVLQENEAAVAEYKSGKENALKFLLGQAMKLSKGTANPALVTEILTEKMN